MVQTYFKTGFKTCAHGKLRKFLFDKLKHMKIQRLSESFKKVFLKGQINNSRQK